MRLDSLIQKIKQINSKKDYVLGFTSTDSGIVIKSSDNEPKTFLKLLLNLMLQEQFKPVKDGGYIDFDVIFNVFQKNARDYFRKNAIEIKPYDYSSISGITPVATTVMPNLLLGNSIKKQAQKIQKKLDEATYYGLKGNYLLFINADDQIYTLLDNEDRSPLLAFHYFVRGCKKYKLNPNRVLRVIKKNALSLKKPTMIGTSNSDNDLTPLIFYKIASGGRIDFNRDVSQFELDQKVTSTVIKNLTYKYAFCDYFLSTEQTMYTLATRLDDANTLGYLKDIFHDFSFRDSSAYSDDEPKIQQLLNAYDNAYHKFKKEDVLDGVFPKSDQTWMQSNHTFPITHPAYPTNSDDINAKILNLFQRNYIVGYSFFWHSDKDADENLAGSVGADTDLENISAILIQMFGTLALAHPDIREQLLNWRKTYLD